MMNMKSVQFNLVYGERLTTVSQTLFTYSITKKYFPLLISGNVIVFNINHFVSVLIRNILCCGSVFKMCNFLICGFLAVLLLNIADALKGHCNQQEDLLQRCSMALPVLSSREISFALTQDELDKSCIELRSGIKCIDNYTNVCMEKHEQAVFKKIYAGIKDVVVDLCTRGAYQDEYLKHANCVKNVRPEYEKCSKKYEVTLTTLSDHQKNEQYQTDDAIGASQEDSLRTVCCSFQEYLLCSEQTVQRSCGDEAALFTSAFLKRMASNIIKNFCLEYRGHECGLPDTAGDINNNVVMISITVLANLLAYMSGVWVPT